MFKPYLPKLNSAVISLLCITALQLASCQVYRPELQQGQQIERENVNQIRQGMEPSEVLDILGTPLVVDPFHRSRWDYVYYLLNEDRETVKEATVTIYFTEGKVTDVIHSLPADSETDEEAELSEASEDAESADADLDTESDDNQGEESDEASEEVEIAEVDQAEDNVDSQATDSAESSENTEASEAKKGFKIPGVKWIRNIFKKINKKN